MIELPTTEFPLIPEAEGEICGHLSPVLGHLLKSGNRIEEKETGWPTCSLQVLLADPVDLEQIKRDFSIPHFIVVQEFLDPHSPQMERYLFCNVCKHSIASPRPEPDVDLTVWPDMTDWKDEEIEEETHNN